MYGPVVVGFVTLIVPKVRGRTTDYMMFTTIHHRGEKPLQMVNLLIVCYARASAVAQSLGRQLAAAMGCNCYELVPPASMQLL